ncbi:hypothetical protein CYMTET_31593 [Cymbomonas tetramitiformis]|uniref:Uncharacterized protein n=1 Tax=Cymbomonas tetramitiformis TaxID=36881 RepID=A0AAE0KSR2_9CHLO|nr:hypothetical protein CYMTET_31593 [Cymbomonas tetramitiformis]
MYDVAVSDGVRLVMQGAESALNQWKTLRETFRNLDSNFVVDETRKLLVVVGDHIQLQELVRRRNNEDYVDQRYLWEYVGIGSGMGGEKGERLQLLYDRLRAQSVADGVASTAESHLPCSNKA